MGHPTPNPNECNSTLTSATRGETLTPNPNECNSTLTSGTSVMMNLSPVQKLYQMGLTLLVEVTQNFVIFSVSKI